MPEVGTGSRPIRFAIISAPCERGQIGRWQKLSLLAALRFDPIPPASEIDDQWHR
jgi:hypothetical protein